LVSFTFQRLEKVISYKIFLVHYNNNCFWNFFFWSLNYWWLCNSTRNWIFGSLGHHILSVSKLLLLKIYLNNNYIL
jgi:hypothetical protein